MLKVSTNVVKVNIHLIFMQGYSFLIFMYCFRRLLQKKRNRMEEEIWPQESYVWNRISQEFIKPDVSFPPEPTDVFLPHSTIVLHKDNLGGMDWQF